MLQRLRLAAAYQARIASLRRLINACDKEIDVVAKAIGYRMAQLTLSIPGAPLLRRTATHARHKTSLR